MAHVSARQPIRCPVGASCIGLTTIGQIMPKPDVAAPLPISIAIERELLSMPGPVITVSCDDGAVARIIDSRVRPLVEALRSSRTGLRNLGCVGGVTLDQIDAALRSAGAE